MLFHAKPAGPEFCTEAEASTSELQFGNGITLLDIVYLLDDM